MFKTKFPQEGNLQKVSGYHENPLQINFAVYRQFIIIHWTVYHHKSDGLSSYIHHTHHLSGQRLKHMNKGHIAQQKQNKNHSKTN